MRSEKLKQLVKDKVPLKFRINCPSQSRELQDFFFALDVGWAYDSAKILMHLDKSFLFYRSCGVNGLTQSNIDDIWFYDRELKEFDLANDRIIEECKWPNLKELIESRTSLKFRIKSEKQGNELQELMFSLGVYWHYGAEEKIINIEKRNLVCSYYLKQYCFICKNSCCFNEDESNLYDLDNDCLIESCKWPNLKKLVEAKTELKFRIKSEEQFKELQNFMFALDVRWYEGERECKYLDMGVNFLYCGGAHENAYCLRLQMFNPGRCFLDSDKKEFDLINDCLLKEEEEEEKCRLRCIDKILSPIVLYKNPAKEDLSELLRQIVILTEHVRDNISEEKKESGGYLNFNYKDAILKFRKNIRHSARGNVVDIYSTHPWFKTTDED